MLAISSDYFNKDLNSFQVNGRIVLQKQQFLISLVNVTLSFSSTIHAATLTSCQRWRSRILELPGYPVPPEVYVPECEEDGRFRKVQCSTSTGECWCVTDDGYMIWGSSVMGKPNCVKKGDYANFAL